jgi:Thioesterase-like superfamily
MSDAFYVRVDENIYDSTAYTRGPWNANSQHAGPPAALLGYAIEHRKSARDDMRLARVSFDILTPVPIAKLHVTTHIERAGRSTEFVWASLAIDDAGQAGAVVMHARALLIRVDPDTTPRHHRDATVDAPETAPAKHTEFPFDVGYHTAIENRYVSGSFTEPGPATVWFRMLYPLIEGEPIDPLSRVLIAADSGNGVSQVLDPFRYVFVNPELTVHLHRYPVGEWVCLDANSTIDSDGIGLADTALFDVTGQIGRGTQSLYVAPR